MPKIDLTAIEGYQDMTPEQKVAALEGFEYTVPTADYTGYVKKDLLDKANSEAAKYKKQARELMDEASRKAAEEKEEREKMEEELATLKKEKAVSEHKASFLALGYDEALALETANAVVDGDIAKVLANQKTHQDALEKKVKADLLKKTPTPPAGGADKGMTKEQFSRLNLDEKTKIYNENPELFKQMTE